jgi:hypothetical protein
MTQYLSCSEENRVAARYKHEITGIVGTNPTRSIDVCPRFLCVWVVLCG